MKTVTKTETMYLHLWPKFKDEYLIFTHDATSSGYIMVAKKEIEVTFEIPDDLNLTQLEIDGITQEKERIQAATHVKIQNLDDQIQRLLAIGHDEGKSND